MGGKLISSHCMSTLPTGTPGYPTRWETTTHQNNLQLKHMPHLLPRRLLCYSLEEQDLEQVVTKIFEAIEHPGQGWREALSLYVSPGVVG